MGGKSAKHKKDATQLTDDEIDRLVKNTTYSKQQIHDWHQGFLRYEGQNQIPSLFDNETNLCCFSVS